MKSNAFKGVWIHKEVFELDLTLHQKMIFAIIQNLVTDDEPCYASNKYIGDILNLSERQVSRHISLLKQLEFIDYRQPRKINGEYEKRKITVRHKTHSVKTLPKVSIGSEESSIPNMSTYNKELYKKEYNKHISKSSKKVIKDKKDEDFIKFWNTIPSIRRINKNLTRKHWKEATHKESVETVQRAMELFVERVEPQYIKTSYNWLKLEYWKRVPQEKKVRKGFELI